MKFTERCMGRAACIDSHTSWKYARIIIDQDVPELCRRLDESVKALRTYASNNPTFGHLMNKDADALEKLPP